MDGVERSSAWDGWPESVRRYVLPPVRIGSRERWAWAGVAAACAAVLSLAAWLKPDPRGHGTHEQLGLAPCSMELMVGLPCPTCGMTTAFSLVVRGRVMEAARAQPAGMMMAIGAMLLMAYSAFAAMSGRRAMICWDRLGAVRVALSVCFVMVGAWGFKLRRR